jgi:hypothetical protein
MKDNYAIISRGFQSDHIVDESDKSAPWFSTKLHCIIRTQYCDNSTLVCSTQQTPELLRLV